MTEPQLLDFVDWSIDQLERQLAEANRQRDELHDYLGGRRRSKHRLGSVYYLKWGQWLDAVARTTTEWESRYERT